MDFDFEKLKDIDFKQLKNDLNKIQELFDMIYQTAKDGKVKFKGAIALSEETLKDCNNDKEDAIKKLQSSHIKNCTIDGAVTSVGGLPSMMALLPINLISVVIMQARLVECIAYISGNDLNSDETKDKVMKCIVCLEAKDFVKAGIVKEVKKQLEKEMAKRAAEVTVEKISNKAMQKIIADKGPEIIMKTTLRVSTSKFATKISASAGKAIGKAVPVVSAAIGGGMDFFSTKAISKYSYNLFVIGNDVASWDNIMEYAERVKEKAKKNSKRILKKK